MAQMQSTARVDDLNVTLSGVTTPTISNTTLGTAGIETGISIPASTRKFTLCARGQAKLQLAYVSTESGTTFITVWPGGVYSEEIDSAASLTVYVQATKDSEVIELLSWS